MKASEFNGDLNLLKSEIEKETQYEFEHGKDCLGDSVLRLIGLNKKAEIILRFSKLYSGDEVICVDGSSTYGDYFGFGSPCGILGQVIDNINRYAPQYGYKAKNKQMAFI